MRSRTPWLFSLALLVLACPSDAQAPGRSFGFGPLGGGPELLSMPAVQAELKLDATQQSRLRELGQTTNARFGNLTQYQGLSPDQRDKRVQALMQERDQQIDQILKSDQRKRWKELQLQKQGFHALSRPEIQEQLRLSAYQKKAVQDLGEDERERGTRILTGPSRVSGGQDALDQGRVRKIEALRKAFEKQLEGLLTVEQRRQFEAMQGAPFSFPDARPRAPRPNGDSPGAPPFPRRPRQPRPPGFP